VTNQPDDPTERRARTRDLILTIQLATDKSRKRHAYAREAWAALDEPGQVAALVARADAIGEAVELNRGLIVNMARKWRGVCDDVIQPEEVFSAAQEGYINSLILFDLYAGFEFSTYVTRAMQHTIVRMVDDLQPFGQSVSVTRSIQLVRKASAAHLTAYGSQPTLGELVADTGLDTDVVKAVLKMPIVLSGDGFDGDSEDGLLDETAAPEDTEMQAEIAAAVARAEESFGPSWRDFVGSPLGDELLRVIVGTSDEEDEPEEVEYV